MQLYEQIKHIVQNKPLEDGNTLIRYALWKEFVKIINAYLEKLELSSSDPWIDTGVAVTYETKRHEIKRNETKPNETKSNETKRNETEKKTFKKILILIL